MCVIKATKQGVCGVALCYLSLSACQPGAVTQPSALLPPALAVGVAGLPQFCCKQPGHLAGIGQCSRQARSQGVMNELIEILLCEVAQQQCWLCESCTAAWGCAKPAVVNKSHCWKGGVLQDAKLAAVPAGGKESSDLSGPGWHVCLWFHLSLTHPHLCRARMCVL